MTGTIGQSTLNQDLITFTIKVDGNTISDKYQFVSLSIKKEINRIPSASLVLIDGDPSSGQFEASSSDTFVPGKVIEIFMGYHSDEELAFEGVVISQNIRIRTGSSRLNIECKNKLFKTTISKQNRVFTEGTDSDAMEEILSEYGLTNNITPTKIQHQELVQYQVTDWDFILNRSDINNKVCLINDDEIIIDNLDFDQESIFVCAYGDNIIELDTTLSGKLQYEGVTAKGWDFSTQEIVEIDAEEPNYSPVGNLSGKDLSDKLEQPLFKLSHSGNLKNEELQVWANAKLRHSRLAAVKGRVKVQGVIIRPGKMMTLKGIGERFNGKVLVSGVLHQLFNGSWTTDIQFGLDEKWFTESFNISNLPAAGLIPAIQGLQNGVVTQLEEDPEGEDRIKVKFPIIDPASDGIWCRLACLDAGSTRGTFFRPEIGDEVIVGFINQDPRDAVVLGMLHSSAKPTPEPITNDNHKKGYHSRGLLKMEFDDELKTISFETPGGNTCKLDDDAGGIFLEDQNGNKITLDSNGVTVESAKDLIFKTSAGDATLEAMNITASAQIALKTEGSASAEISSGGTTTVKGTLVQIN